MDTLFEPTDTQSQMLASLGRWLDEAAPFTRRAALLATPDAVAPLWHGLATELGLAAATLPEAQGGLLEAGPDGRQPDGGDERLLIARRLGAALLPEPWLASSAHAAVLLQAAGADGGQGPLAAELLAGLADGRICLAVADREPQQRQADRHGLRSTASPQAGGGWRISGRKAGVRAAPWASHWLVTAAGPGGQPVVAVVAPDGAGITRRPLQLADGAWAAELAFDDTPALPLLDGPAAAAALQQADDARRLATGAEAVGVMQRLLDETASYLLQRRQFGVALASFQALQHRLADMHLAMVQAAAAVGASRGWLTGAPPDAPARQRALSSMWVAVLRAARTVGQGAVQLHGGMGMTEELAIGHGFKRLTVIEQQLGSVDHHLQRVATLDAALAGAAAAAG